MPNILALDTSSDYCSVTLYSQGKLTSEGELAPRTHTQILMPMIQSALDSFSLSLNDMDAVAFGCGPGSFTGLRIAAGVAQGLSFGVDCPVIPISSLQAMALQRYRKNGEKNIVVALDARMDEVYWMACQIKEVAKEVRIELLTEELVGSPESLFLPDSHVTRSFAGIGSGFMFATRFPQTLQDAITSYDESARPHSEAICELAVQEFEQGKVRAPADALPTYIRDKVTWKKLPGRN